ncbi:MAG: hypothetical protein M3348_15370 [Acidobacteriota bacterium]|nr:hypothetical protein [Acidobacteriota bacterium]
MKDTERPQRRKVGQRAYRRHSSYRQPNAGIVLPTYIPQEATEMYKRGLRHGILLASGQERSWQTLTDSEVERTFRTLADEWLSETAHLSNPVDKFMHPALVQIIGLGKQAVPLILMEVQKQSGHWFYALEHINRMNPVLPEDQWDLEKTADAWLEWGRRERLI